MSADTGADADASMTIGDAGTTMGDGGLTGADAGTMTGAGAMGATCTKDSDCASQQCDRQAPGGYCTAKCGVNSDCPDGSACEQLGHGRTMCMPLCTTQSACRAGLNCLQLYDVCAPGASGCQADTDCPHGQTCDTTAGLCSGGAETPNTIGGACLQDPDCTIGPQPSCLTDNENFSGGYCTSSCGSSDDCNGNPCVQDIFGPGYSLCMQSCTSNSDCRPNYNCVQFQGQRFCFNACQSDSDCLVAGQTCDPGTGLCGGGPDAGVDAGPTSCSGVDGSDAGQETADGGSPAVDGGDVADAGSTSTYPAPFPTPPQVVNSGGPLLKAPKLVPIFFANDDTSQVQQLEDFDNRVGSSTYWTAITQEYGIGPATVAAAVHLSEVATGTIDDSSIGPWLEARIEANQLPPPDADTLYVIHYPESMAITLQGSLSCSDFGGYHFEYQPSPSATSLAYAVIPRCQPYPGSDSTVVDVATITESHELLEAVTDPFPNSNPAYGNVDDDHWYWSFGATELGDMCENDPNANTQFPGLPYMVQRTWSNAAALAGHDPCVPALPDEVYFNAAPEQNDEVTLTFPGQPPLMMKGVSLPDCTPRTITVDLFSDGPTTSPWQVEVYDQATWYGGTSTISYTLDQPTGQNGDKLKLTIQALQPNPGNYDVFYVTSTSDTTQHTWAGIVVQ